jgi:AcrR family transcriptional regulator
VGAVTRLTRSESQARTRERLVETARTMFLRDGYAATSLEKVAEEAGFSKGAVYSNFDGKDALCLAVLDTIHQEVATAVVGALDGAATVEEALEVFDLWAEARLGDPDWSALEAEFAARSRRDPQLRTALGERNRRIRDVIAGALRRSCQEQGIDLAMSFEDAASALLSLGIGLGLQRSLAADLPVHVLSDVVRVITGLPLPDRSPWPERPRRQDEGPAYPGRRP